MPYLRKRKITILLHAAPGHFPAIATGTFRRMFPHLTTHHRLNHRENVPRNVLGSLKVQGKSHPRGLRPKHESPRDTKGCFATDCLGEGRTSALKADFNLVNGDIREVIVR